MGGVEFGGKKTSYQQKIFFFFFGVFILDSFFVVFVFCFSGGGCFCVCLFLFICWGGGDGFGGGWEKTNSLFTTEVQQLTIAILLVAVQNTNHISPFYRETRIYGWRKNLPTQVFVEITYHNENWLGPHRDGDKFHVY